MKSGERVIKRYGNRKLYDPEARRYVTLPDLARMVGRGQEVRVVDQKTGEDLTSMVLAQVIQEALKQRTASIPQQVLTRLIRLGAAPASAWREWTGHDGAVKARQEAERIVGGLVSRGRLTLDEALALRQEITGSVQRLVSEAQSGLEGRLRSLVERSEKEQGVSPALSVLKERLMTFEALLSPAPSGAPKGRKARRKA